MTIHNLRFYQTLMQGLRDAIEAGTLEAFVSIFLEKLSSAPGPTSQF
jgi:queuine tRNA-ribosyltransferase